MDMLIAVGNIAPLSAVFIALVCSYNFMEVGCVRIMQALCVSRCNVRELIFMVVCYWCKYSIVIIYGKARNCSVFVICSGFYDNLK